MYYFGDVMYAMGMNIMKSVCVKYGQTNDTGKKFVKFDEVVKLVGDATKEPNNSGDYKDYIELMKLYDKNENGTIMIAELETMLSLLGNSIRGHSKTTWTRWGGYTVKKIGDGLKEVKTNLRFFGLS